MKINKVNYFYSRLTIMTKLEINNKNHIYLRYTILLLFFPIFYCLLKLKNKKTRRQIIIVEYILVILLIITIIFSQMFWGNPIKNSRIHKLDAIVAKIVMISFAIYTIKYKFKISFIFILLAILILSYFSNYYSNKEWCSNKHLLYHGLLHICCFLATIYTFYPV